MGEPWRERSIDRSGRPIIGPVARTVAQEGQVASEALTSAIVGFVVALVTSLGVSIACFVYLR
jgi:uncharacterized protein involved in cysteine biosynthesis